MVKLNKYVPDYQTYNYTYADYDEKRGSYSDISIPLLGKSVKTVSAEAVSLAAGAAGTTGKVSLSNIGAILSTDGSRVGYYWGAGDSNTSLAIDTGDAIDTEVLFEKRNSEADILSNLSNGEYAVDYINGIIYYKKTNANTAMTFDYKYWQLLVDTEINVESDNITINNIKTFSTDNTAANTEWAKINAAQIPYSIVTNADATVYAYAYAEDSQHVSGDGGLLTFAVRNDAGTSLVGTDGDYAPLSVDASGSVWAALGNVEYTDDSNEFTVASSKGLALMAIATSDSVDADDVGALRMTVARNLGVDITTKDGAAWAVGNAINATIGDGTTVPVVETAGTKKALNVNITDGTNDMPTMDAVGRAGYIYLTDGTNTANTMDAAARAGYQYITDGTNTMPTLDVVGRAGFIQITDGTNTMPTMDANTRPGFINITDGTTEVDVIAATAALKTDLSSVAGTATNVNGGNRDAGTQTVTLADDDPAVASLATMDAAIYADSATFTAASDSGMAVGGTYEAAETAVSDGEFVVARYTDVGHLKTRADGYDLATDSQKVFEVSPLNMQYESGTLVTAGAAATSFYVNMEGAKQLTLQFMTMTDTLVTIHASVDPDEIGDGSGDYVDVTNAYYGAASVPADTDSMVIIDAPTAFRWVKITTADDGGGSMDHTIHYMRNY